MFGTVDIVKNLGYTSSASVTRANTTTAYTAGDVIGTAQSGNLTFNGCGSLDNGHIQICGVSLEIDVNAVPSGMDAFRLHLYNDAPTAIADNSAFNLVEGDRAKYLGNINITIPIDLGDTLFVNIDSINFKRQLASGSTKLYGMLETIGGFTPTASAVHKITLHIVEV